MALSNCGGCNQKFTLEKDFPQMPHPSTSPRDAPPSWWSSILHRFDNAVAFPYGGIDTSILITFPCTHIFHTVCMKGWAQDSHIPCPNCKVTLIRDQVGKSYTQLVTIFLSVLEQKKDAQIVIKALDKSDHQGTNCTVCTDLLPPIPITYQNQRLYHQDCGSKYPHMQLDDLTKIVNAIIDKDPTLKAQFTPIHPTFLGRFRINHPRWFFVGCLELLSLIALVFNRSKYNGQNRTLSVLGYPAYSTLVLTHLVGKAVIFILSSQRNE